MTAIGEGCTIKGTKVEGIFTPVTIKYRSQVAANQGRLRNLIKVTHRTRHLGSTLESDKGAFAKLRYAEGRPRNVDSICRRLDSLAIVCPRDSTDSHKEEEKEKIDGR
jgi:hypothetical protein